jgi:hypothetical protein
MEMNEEDEKEPSTEIKVLEKRLLDLRKAENSAYFGQGCGSRPTHAQILEALNLHPAQESYIMRMLASDKQQWNDVGCEDESILSTD